MYRWVEVQEGVSKFDYETVHVCGRCKSIYQDEETVYQNRFYSRSLLCVCDQLCCRHGSPCGSLYGCPVVFQLLQRNEV